VLHEVDVTRELMFYPNCYIFFLKIDNIMVVVVERQYKHDFEYSVVVILIGGGVG